MSRIKGELGGTRRAITVERVQTGVRLEKGILKVSKALAELLDLTFGDLLEGVLLHAFEGKSPFGTETLRKIAELKKVYGLELDAKASHRMTEAGGDHSGRYTGRGRPVRGTQRT